MVTRSLSDANAYFPFIRKNCLERKSRSSPTQRGRCHIEKLSKQLLEYDESPLHSLTRLRSSAFSVARLRKLTERSTVDIARRGISS